MLTKGLLLPLLITSATAAPSVITPELLQTAAVIHDTHWSGQNECNPGQCRVYKAWSNNGHDLTTMLTFTVPNDFQGNTCWLEFYLPGGPGGKQVDIYRQWAPVNACPSQGNNRDLHLGRMSIPAGGGQLQWAEKYSPWMTTPGECPKKGETFGIEIVGAGDDINATWKQAAGVGLRVMYT